MTQEEFNDTVKVVINNYWDMASVDLDDENVKAIEEVTTHDFKKWNNEEEVYCYILGLRDMNELTNSSYRYFEEEEE